MTSVIEQLFTNNIEYKLDGNIIHFILNENDRPMWSMALERSYTEFGGKLDMRWHFENSKKQVSDNEVMQHYFSYITENNGIIIDLASGPSGYFAPVLDLLKPDSLFIATDACPTVLKAYSDTNNSEQFLILDLDLDKPLPLKSRSVDVFCGNLLDNVNNYRELICEAYRCLKDGGRFAVIELFFEKNSPTYDYLIEQNAVYSSLETYIDYCERLGFKYIGSELLRESKGKIDPGDLLPIDENDKSVVRTVYFEKVTI